ncbi:TRAP transporter small permease [Bacillus sp. Marseille-P3661]|uniref:TRAP transporter small permease n=1 Tax=Bacillus sp. Marseille-P3661 TaxID=1936234 RepID=UPI000C8545AF|nr:TRAP transporter small permease [Bacillus sp. Marseille-P3661]
MKNPSNALIKLSEILERIAGFVFLLVMLLVVANILLRAFFQSPIAGTYDYVGFLTAIGIALALANCAIHRGHIAVDFFIEKLSGKIQAIIDLFMGLVAGVFFLLTSWEIAKYGYSMVLTGQKSPSAMIAYYPFIYIVAFGVFIMALIILYQLSEPFRKLVKK